MVETTLYWHDYETFGSDPRWDGPAQFAGLRTDLNFNPIGEPLLVYCRPPLDRLPAPEACLITGITPQLAETKGLRERDFAAAIHAELSQPGTCALGYNTLRFDDEVTRNLLYRNFYDPYEREWRGGNSRWDIIDMVRLTAALRPAGVEWPRDEQGRPSFKLERLTHANGISHEGAHDALVDVRATVSLARLIKDRQPRLFEFAWNNRSKQAVADLLKLGSFQPLLHVSEKYPAERGCIAVVVALAQHPSNLNEVAVYDLSFDPGPLLELDVESIRQRLYTRKADLPEGVERIALKTVHLNRCPILVPMKALLPEDAERLAIDLGACERHRLQLQAAEALPEKIRSLLQRPEGEQEAIDDPDLMIYRGGFFSASDKQKMARLREMPPAQLAQTEPVFEDRRLPEMLFRYRARNWPESLNPVEQARWSAFCRERIFGESAGAGQNLASYLARLEALSATPDLKAGGLEILAALKVWGEQLTQACQLRAE